jgi:hypothetical protein
VSSLVGREQPRWDARVVSHDSLAWLQAARAEFPGSREPRSHSPGRIALNSEKPRVPTLASALFAGLIALLLASGAAAQEPVGASPGEPDRASPPAAATTLPPPESFGLAPGRPRVSPTRTDTPPRIDGVLDDPVWLTAARITEFTQQQPLDGAPASEATEVWIAYDSDNLYFAFHAHYRDPSIMRANRVERDRAMADDLITIYFDTFLDQQRGYDFDVNAFNVQGDGILTTGGGRGGRGGGMAIPPADRSWNGLFDSGARIVEDGFTAEMAIPFKSLRYPRRAPGEPHRWGFQIVREVKGKSEENIVWAPMSRNQPSFFAQMGLIEGMTDLTTSRNVEILPTATAIQHGSIDPTRPAFVNRNPDPDVGINLKYGVTSNLTADFTLNPDFSQIESDRGQIEVNLRFPISFPELRPFFVEGAEIFAMPAPVTFVHTRTIVDPDYGAKLTGQIGRFSLGVLTANDQAPGNVGDPSDPAFDKTAQTFIARGVMDLGGERNVGLIFTDREFLDGHSRVGGTTSNFRLSRTLSGDFSALNAWYQRPGASQVTGNMLSTRLSRNGRSLGWSAYVYQISPHFRTDVGFVRRRDVRSVGSNLSYRFWPESWLINWGPQVNYSRNYDFDGILEDENLRLGLGFNLARSISLNADVNRDMERWSGIEFEKTSFGLGGRVNTSRRYSFGGNVSYGDEIYYAGDLLGKQFSWNVNGSIRPNDSWQTSLNFNASRLTDPASGDAEIFDVKIIRANTTYQLTSRLGVRNVTEFNTEDQTFDLNVLFNYRVNAGTVVYLGYDDHYRQGDRIFGDTNGDGFEEQLYYTGALRRTNRAIFAKIQYLFRM